MSKRPPPAMSSDRALHRLPMLSAILALALLFAGAPPAPAQLFRRADREQSKEGEGIRSAFHDVVAGASRSAVLVKCDGKRAALGTVVGADGWIVTKASELTGPITCTGPDAAEVRAKLIGISEQNDLALLKAEGGRWTPIAWGDASKVEVGQWVASADASDKPLAIGVVSVGRRKIPGRNGFLGVMLADADGGAKIVQVIPDGPADKAGLRVDDVILRINDKPVDSRDALVTLVRTYMPGQGVTLEVRRGDREIDVKATLVGTLGAASRAEIMNQMGGPLSGRNANFPAVLQHDTVLLPNQCGGPVVTLDGKAIGINIARAGRVESYALPADVVIALLPELKSGKLAPPAPATRPLEPPATRPGGRD